MRLRAGGRLLDSWTAGQERKCLMVGTPFQVRLDRFRRLMMEHEVDAFLVAVPENRFYLSGYGEEDRHLTESSGYLLISLQRQLLLTDPRYEEAAKIQAPDFDPLIYRKGLAELLAEVFSDLQVKVLGVEGHYLTYQQYKEVEEALRSSRPGSRIVFPDALVESLRVIKEPCEIDLIRASLDVTEKVLNEIWQRLQPGMTETNLAWEIESSIRTKGAQAVSFPPIVAGGPNAALPHAVPTRRPIAEGETLVLDLGSKLDHYCSDITRTWIWGKPDAWVREIYRIVREAQLAAQTSIRDGANSVEVDGVARKIIENAGYGPNFGHGLGHGVGLAVHEKPGIRKQDPTILRENMVITVEPGIYLPGCGGVRLENMVRVTSNGCEVLNETSLFYEFS